MASPCGGNSDLELDAESDGEVKEGTPEKPAGTKRKDPDSADSKAKGGSRHKGDASKKGFKVCRACQKSKPLSAFALNQVVDMECKKALDVIGKKAKQQGKVDWLKNAKKDPKKLKHLVTSYRNACAEAEKVGAKKAAWNLAEYVEEVRSTSEMVGIGRGKLMWRDQAIDFWRSTDGGAHTKQESEAKWEELVSNYQTLGVPHDFKGPAKSSLRIRVHTEDILDDVKRFSREKTLGLFNQKPAFLFAMSLKILGIPLQGVKLNLFSEVWTFLCRFVPNMWTFCDGLLSLCSVPLGFCWFYALPFFRLKWAL